MKLLSLELKKSISGHSKGSIFKVEHVLYDETTKEPLIIAYNDKGKIKRHLSDFKLDNLKISGQKVDIRQNVTFLVKSEKQLLSEGWEYNDKGTLKKSGAFYKFTKKKQSYIGKVMSGSVKVNPSLKLCVTDNENGWGFDESMIESITTELPFKEVEEEISGVVFYGQGDGSLRIEDYYFDKVETRKIIKLLLKHHKFVEE